MIFKIGKLYKIKRQTLLPLFFRPLGEKVWLDLTEKDILLCMGTILSNGEMPIFLFDNKQGTVDHRKLISGQMEEVCYDIRGGQVIHTNK